MLLLIAFALFAVLMIAWLMMPTTHERGTAAAKTDPAPRGTASLQTQV